MPLLSLLFLTLPFLSFAQARPNLDAQKSAMKKLAFLAGEWSGEATVQVGPGKPLQLVQTEEIEFRLDGTVLLIEGRGKEPETGKLVFNAVAIVSYDESKSAYEIRAYSDGRKVDAAFETDGSGFAWGFQSGPASLRHVMRLSEAGEWIETSTVKLPEGREFVSVRMKLKKL